MADSVHAADMAQDTTDFFATVSQNLEGYWDYWYTYLASYPYILFQLSIVLVLALAFVFFTNRKKKRPLLRAWRVLFHRKVWRHESTKLDWKYLFLNTLPVSVIMAGAIISSYWCGVLAERALVAAFDAREAVGWPEFWVTATIMAVTYLAYEFAYWLDHYLSHKVMFLWEFHKVHHSAEVLTPLTLWRVHPVDTLVYYNIKGVIIGVIYGVACYLMGREVVPMGENFLFMVYMLLYGHLQHSQVWIPFTGKWGKVFFSPAHHQLHHSSANEHFDKNFGASLAIFDAMFGTLVVPDKKQPKLKFGVNGKKSGKEHQLEYSLLNPFTRAGKRLTKRWRKAKAPVATEYAVETVVEADYTQKQ